MASTDKPYTIAYHEALSRLAEARVSLSQERAYLMLAQFHGASGAGECECWTVANVAAPVVHMSTHNFSTALRGLTRREFKDGRGRMVPVLVRMRGGYSNNPTVYYDNVFADIKGVETLTPKGVETLTPKSGVENQKGVEPEPERGCDSDSKGLGAQPPYKKEKKNRGTSGGALRPAHSAARRRESTQEAETRDVDSLVSGIAGADAGETPGEPGPLEAETLREAWAAYNAGRDLTADQEATHRRFARSRAWEDIRRGL